MLFFQHARHSHHLHEEHTFDSISMSIFILSFQYSYFICRDLYTRYQPAEWWPYRVDVFNTTFKSQRNLVGETETFLWVKFYRSSPYIRNKDIIWIANIKTTTCEKTNILNTIQIEPYKFHIAIVLHAFYLQKSFKVRFLPFPWRQTLLGISYNTHDDTFRAVFRTKKHVQEASVSLYAKSRLWQSQPYNGPVKTSRSYYNPRR